jgi:hypothetical protein
MPAWLDQVNAFRALGNLPPVTENTQLSAAATAMCQYEVMNLSQLSHLVDQPNTPYSTAAQNSNLYSSADPNTLDSAAIAAWASSVFHAIGIISAALQTVGYGVYRNTGASRPMNMVAAIMIPSNWSDSNPPAYPFMWPADTKTIVQTTYSGDIPDARSTCGYTGPAGQPIFLQVAQPVTGQVTSSLLLNGAPIPFCEIDGNNYTNPDPTYQLIGRGVLSSYNAVVLLPRDPLVPGTYTAAITVNGLLYPWTFYVQSPDAPIALSYAGPRQIGVGQSFQGEWTATGGNGGPYVFSTPNALPTGVTLSPTGVLGGRLLDTSRYEYPIVVRATDSSGANGDSSAFQIVAVQAPITVLPADLPDAIAGKPYSVQLEATGGVAPYTFPAVGTGDGITLKAGGLLSGTPPLQTIPVTGSAFSFILTDATGTPKRVSISLIVRSS